MRKIAPLTVPNYLRILTLLAALGAAVLAISLLALATHHDKPAHAAQTHHTTTDFQEQIVDGQRADRGEYPAQGALFFNVQNGQPYQGCGGTLVDSTHLLTAAHCVVDGSGNHISPQEMFVVLGEVDLTN